MKKILIALTMCSLLFVTGCGKIPKLDNGKDMVASLDGKEFSIDDLYQKMKEQGGTSILVNMIDEYIANKEYETDEDAKTYADAQIKQLKASYEANGQDFTSALVNAGYKDENAFRDYIILDYKKNKVVEKYLTDQLTDKEIQKYYDETVFGEMDVRHILIKPDVKTDATADEKKKAEEAALTKAKELVTKLNNGEDFEKLAKENSQDDGTKANGGLISGVTYKSNYVTEFIEGAKKLEIGKYTVEPVKSTYGYHIIMKVSQKDKPSLDTVKDSIKEDLVQNKLEDDKNLTMKVWGDVRKKYNLNIVDSDLKDSYERTIKALNDSTTK